METNRCLGPHPKGCYVNVFFPSQGLITKVTLDHLMSDTTLFLRPPAVLSGLNTTHFVVPHTIVYYVLPTPSTPEDPLGVITSILYVLQFTGVKIGDIPGTLIKNVR